MKDKFGLRKLPKDNNDYKLGNVFAIPKDIPEEFQLSLKNVKNQKSSDMCVAFSATLASEYQENVELSPEYAFAKGKQITGDINEWGLTLRDIHKALQKYGIIEAKDAPFKL